MYEYKAMVRRVVDGDTVDLDLDLGCSIHVYERCRLYGINAPESFGVKKNSKEYKAGIAAKEYLRSLIEGKEVMVQTFKDKKGKYGRYLATIILVLRGETINVNLLMEREGHAVAYFGGKR